MRDRAPRLAMMMSVKNEADVIGANLRYHRFLGVQKAYVFLDGCSDNTREILGPLDWVTSVEHPRRPDCEHLTTHLNDCAMVALNMAREDGFDWLLHLDVDEFGWGGNAAGTDLRSAGCLVRMVERAGSNTELITMKTRESIPVNGLPMAPIWRQLFFQCEPHVLERAVLDPTSGMIVQLKKWIGHNQGKSLVRTDVDAVPASSHLWVRRNANGHGPTSLTREWLGWHYHFVVGDAARWRRKYQSLSAFPDTWETGDPVPFPKQAWKDASVRLTEKECLEYFHRWVAVDLARIASAVMHGEILRDSNVADVIDRLMARGPDEA